MKDAKVFWGWLVLWTGGVLALSLASSWLLFARPQVDYAGLREINLLYFGTWIGRGGSQERMVETIALALCIASYPAGFAAARHVVGSGRRLRSLLAALLPLVPLCFLLVGYVIPDAARQDSPGTPAYRQHYDYLYFHELASAAARQQARADSAVRAINPRFVARFPELARTVARMKKFPGAEAAASYRAHARFTVAFAFFPALLALIGLCVGLWSAQSPPAWRRLQAWVGGLVLSGAMVVHIGWWGSPWGPAIPFPWINLVDRGASVLIVPILLLLPLAWTLVLARDRFFPAPAPAPSEPPLAKAHVA